MLNEEIKIVIVGGGFAGARATQGLAAAGFKNVTLIDKKDYFEVTYASLRALVQPQTGIRSRKRYIDFIKGKFHRGAVTILSPKLLSLADGQEIPFDIAVLATGSSYSTFPVAKSEKAMLLDERSHENQEAHTQLENSQNILIIGGGIVGVELAGEVADHYPDKSICLAQAGDELVPELKPKARKLALENLKSLGVEVMLNTYLSRHDNVYKKADLIYKCVGLKPNTAMLNANFKYKLDEKGRVRVDATFQMEGCEGIYAIGDCANVPEGKLGYLADKQAAALVKNIIALSNGKSAKPYKPNPMMSLVPIGRTQGFVQLPFAVTSFKFLINIKQKDMFIDKSFKTLR